MRKSDKVKIGTDAVRAGIMTAGSALTLGFASVKTTAFFGLIATGSVVSVPLLGAFAVGGAAVAGGLALASKRYRDHLIKKEFRKATEESK